ncbi:hypothetical protein HZZ02_17935, partial [Streptococcus danieliae]|nr:hypothetical protein [Streptococcus danieliae]
MNEHTNNDDRNDGPEDENEKRRKLLRYGVIGGGLAAFAASFSTTAGRMVDHALGKDKPVQRLHGNSLPPEFSVDTATGKLTVHPDQQVSY